MVATCPSHIAMCMSAIGRGPGPRTKMPNCVPKRPSLGLASGLKLQSISLAAAESKCVSAGSTIYLQLSLGVHGPKTKIKQSWMLFSRSVLHGPKFQRCFLEGVQIVSKIGTTELFAISLSTGGLLNQETGTSLIFNPLTRRIGSKLVK